MQLNVSKYTPLSAILADNNFKRIFLNEKV